MEYQQKNYKNRAEWMKEEFGFSDKEIEELEKFICGREKGLTSEFLRSVIDSGLNDKQKVIISYMMGIFIEGIVQEQMRNIEKTMMESNRQPEFGG